MAHGRSALRVNFRTKVLAPVVAILVLLMSITTWMVDKRISQQFERDALERLTTSEKLFLYFQNFHSESLLARYTSIMGEPRLKAISQLDDELTLQRSFHDLINELNADKVGVSAIVFTSADDRPMISAIRERWIDANLLETNAGPSINRAIETGAAADDIRPVGEHLFTFVSVPVNVRGQITGVITFASEVGDDLAGTLSQLTSSEIVFLASNQTIVSTLRKAAQQRDFSAHLNEFATGGHAQAEAHKVVLGGEHFFWRARPFRTAHGTTPFNYVLLSSYEEPWRTLQETQRILLGVRLGSLAFAVAIIWFLVQRVTQPLRDLRDGAEAVGRGDFSRRIVVNSPDEFGDLANAFNEMSGNVKASREQLEQTVEKLQTTRAQLVQSEKLSVIGEFVAGVAHELNNPLTSVVGFAELLNQQEKDPKLQDYARKVVQSAMRSHKIVQNLLAFARQHPPERKPANLNEIIDSVVEILHYELRTGNVEIRRHYSKDLPMLLGDSHQLQQVFLNIMNNARQAMEGRPNSAIDITTERVGEKLRVTFRDNGPGIPEENARKIFDPFFTTKPIGKGTGLGLSLSYGIIQEHGGSIRLESKLGAGAAFVIELPIADREAVTLPTAGSKGVGAPRPMSQRRLLAIDDEEAILDLAREALSESGYHVEIAVDGETALARLRDGSFDLVLCDWKMPGLSGQQIYERLAASNPAMAKRMIFMTGDVMNERTQEFLTAHDKLCISKPFSIEELCTVVRKATEQI